MTLSNYCDKARPKFYFGSHRFVVDFVVVVAIVTIVVCLLSLFSSLPPSIVFITNLSRPHALLFHIAVPPFARQRVLAPTLLLFFTSFIRNPVLLQSCNDEA